MRRTNPLSLLLVVCTLTVSVADSNAAEPTSSAETAVTENGNVPLEVYEAPRRKKLIQPSYALGERRGEREGWVAVNFMVDPKGKPYEIVVVDSTGNKTFERAAVSALEASSFEPAKSGGAPIDASYALKYTFRLNEPSDGAQPKFVSAHRRLMKALDAKDREQADAAFASMEVQNLYEDAHFHFAKAAYLTLWGTEAEQIKALKNAIADEKCPIYLPRAQFTAALNTLLNLQARSQDYGGALETWNAMHAECLKKEDFSHWQELIDQIHLLRDDARSFSVSGSLGNSPWYSTLLKRKFRLDVVSGHISEIKLRCEKKYVFFQYQRDLLYKVADNAGRCGIEVIGDPDTSFELIQS